MTLDYLLIGQGIAGTWLSYFLSKKPVSFLVMDEGHPGSSSRVAAGLINPVTGRRLVKSWRIDELLPFAETQYQLLAEDLGVNTISRRPIIDFFSAPDVKIAFENKLEQLEDYLHRGEDHFCSEFFHPAFGCGIVQPAYTVHLDHLLPAWQKKLEAENRFLAEGFVESELKVYPDHIEYRNIRARRIIFCDGQASADRRFFSNLPFTLNKGEALILEIPDLPRDKIYKKGLTLVPLPTENLWWLGSNYSWNPTDSLPTEAYREDGLLKLKNWLKLPYKLIDHRAALRPATLERRPFIGLHPLYPAIGIFNGMGSKGCSLSPFFAKEFVEFLEDGGKLTPDIDVGRFKRILSS